MKYPILLPNIFNYPFTYTSNKKLKVGQYVLVPFGKSKMTGIVWHEFQKGNNKKFSLKEIIESVNSITLNKSTLKFLDWFSKYNLVPLGMSFKLHLLSNEAVKVYPDNLYDFYIKKCRTKNFVLSDEQKML
tara:strand:+ start:1625 stop:2017 length:393 start_codon:yes stop_codon:yes gene_type:complete